MKATIQHNNKQYLIDLQQPIDISLPITAAPESASAWYCPPVKISPVMTEHFVGDVNQGGAVNFNNVFFNPHGNGTHTECVGHISKEHYSINQVLDRTHFVAQLISINPTPQEEDQIITSQQIKALFAPTPQQEALIIRTLPNDKSKKTRQYSNTNPPFVEAEAMEWLYQQGIRHFMIDTPSVDKEFDDGQLDAHHIFWNYPAAPRLDATITELVYIPNQIPDGLYVLDLQVAAFDNDAAPSKPLLYSIQNKT